MYINAAGRARRRARDTARYPTETIEALSLSRGARRTVLRCVRKLARVTAPATPTAGLSLCSFWPARRTYPIVRISITARLRGSCRPRVPARARHRNTFGRERELARRARPSVRSIRRPHDDVTCAAPRRAARLSTRLRRVGRGGQRDSIAARSIRAK